MTRRITVVTAGVSQPSSTRLLADRLTDATRAAVGARGEDIVVDVLEIRDLAGDLAMTMTTGVPTPALVQARERVSTADGLIAVTPVFTASYSGLFKMFVDALDADAVRAMPVLVAATAGTSRHSLVLDHAMRPLFAFLGAAVVPTGVFAATEDFGAAGPELGDRIRRAADEFAAAVVTDRAAVEGFVPTAPRRTASSGNGVSTAGSTFESLMRAQLD